jgi:hypothetical protein
MSTSLLEPLSVVLDRLVRLAADDHECRDEVRRLARAVLDATESPQDEEHPAARAEIAIATMTDMLDVVTDESRGFSVLEDFPAAVELPLPVLTLGQKSPTTEPTITLPQRWAAKVEDDLALIEARCRLKAKGARWAATRRRLMAEGAHFATEIAPGDRDIIEEAKLLLDCYLWMCRPDSPIPDDLRLWEDVAGCFEAVADGLGVLKQLQYEPGTNQVEFEQALDLLAEAQSALRMSILALDGPTDTDQAQAYNWLRTTAYESQLYIRQHMRLDDPADPTKWADLSGRIEALDSRLQGERERVKERKRLLGKVRHKVSEISKDQNLIQNWKAVVATVDELINGGLPASNRDLRDLLVPVIDDMPDFDDAPVGFQLVLREIDRFLATCPPPDTTPVSHKSAQVHSVAQLLAGKSVVLIGGDLRPAAHRALKEAFQLADLYWVDQSEHEPTDYFEPYIARSDVAAVILAIRWSSHSYTDIRKFCDRYDTPLVRLPGGYNVNQVAMQIMNQCSTRLSRQL